MLVVAPDGSEPAVPTVLADERRRVLAAGHYASGPADKPLIGAAIGAFPEETVAPYRGHEARVGVASRRRYTYTGLSRDVDRLAAGMEPAPSELRDPTPGTSVTAFHRPGRSSKGIPGTEHVVRPTESADADLPPLTPCPRRGTA
jgi:hypothetical protein